jgi:hypothetical protein
VLGLIILAAVIYGLVRWRAARRDSRQVAVMTRAGMGTNAPRFAPAAFTRTPKGRFRR